MKNIEHIQLVFSNLLFQCVQSIELDFWTHEFLNTNAQLAAIDIFIEIEKVYFNHEAAITKCRPDANIHHALIFLCVQGCSHSINAVARNQFIRVIDLKV